MRNYEKNKRFVFLTVFVMIFISAMTSLAETIDLVPFRNEGKFGFYSISKKKMSENLILLPPRSYQRLQGSLRACTACL